MPSSQNGVNPNPLEVQQGRLIFFPHRATSRAWLPTSSAGARLLKRGPAKVVACMFSKWALPCVAVLHGCSCSLVFAPRPMAVSTAPRSFPEACGQKMLCNPMQTAFCINAYVPAGTSHRQNEYFKFHLSLCKVRASKSRWC